MFFYFVSMFLRNNRNWRFRLVPGILIPSVGLLMVGCGNARKEHHWFAMDTGISITLLGRGKSPAPRIFQQLETETHRLERLFSDYDQSSAVSGIRGRAGDTLTVDGEIWRLLAEAMDISRASNGAYSVNLHRLKALWGMGGDETHRVPDSNEIDSVLHLCTGRDTGLFLPVSLGENNRVVLNCDHVQLDLGAIVKGYTADKLSELLLSHGFQNYLIAVGGEIRFGGAKPSGSWRVGVRHPRDTDALAAVLSSETPASISSSGDYERFFIQDSVRYHHIFNPHTGYPARRYCEVTVIAPRGVLSDALSTALFVLDRASGESLLKKYNAQALWIKELPGKGLCVHYSPGMRGWLKVLDLDLCPEQAGELSVTP